MACTFAELIFFVWMEPLASNWIGPPRALLYLVNLIFDQPRYICTKDHGSKVFELTHADDTKVTMTHHGTLRPVETIDVPFKDLKKWKVSKAGMPQLCPNDVVKIHLYHNYGPIVEEIEKAKLYLALAHLAEQHAPNEDLLAFSLAPQHVYAKKDITRKGQLKLIPFGNIAKAKENQSARVFVEKGATKWFITAPKQLSKFEADQAGSLVPFWWVKFGEEANMEYSMLQQDGFKVPILQNCQSIAANSALLLPYPEEEAGEEPEAKAKEKAKAKGSTEAGSSASKRKRS